MSDNTPETENVEAVEPQETPAEEPTGTVDPAQTPDDAATEGAESTGAAAEEPTAESDEQAADEAAEAPAESAEADEQAADSTEAGDQPADSTEAEGADAPAEDEVDPAEEFKAELRMKEGDWYVIHSYAGYENRVKANLENRIVSLDMEAHIFEIQVPMEDVVEIKNGQRKQIRRVRIPGYVLVRMDLTDESWGVVRHTPGVTGFVGNAYDPVPLRLDEVFSMLAPVFEEQQAKAQAEAGAGGGSQAGTPISVEFEVGESVMVKEGSFEGHPATVQEIRPESQKLTVLLSIFERDVPVELGFEQVAKI
ncbi:transcription termination/antitermination protein NusG [Nocardia zapadnayensis]|uniref:transcription termination/antitermination protein NusG n=1 Tax=Brevibacterium sp. R8603A2 TaxID=2929779 RepID=UPI001FFB40F4|nr:transcription termination/antitermination protein NusG [Nocardia zapadnayensis]MCK1803131.1 transcription termination/antitermination protein NusG [Brevibacterium sp. R8603A2]MCX0277175.1 transcription termination/antitermination protein NusG [Nocardia zapadnayensis]